MKKKLYLWIFLAVAIVLCGILLLVSQDIVSKSRSGSSSLINRPNPSLKSEEKPVAQEKVDLTQSDVDFEKDDSDLSDGVSDDIISNDQSNLDSLENEVY